MSTTTSTSNTPSTCAAYCSSLGIPYSGTEYGNECYCSMTVPTVGSTPCTMPCASDSSKTCGGGNAIPWSLSDFKTYITQFHSLFPTYPLWITEWQFTGVSSTATANLVKQALQWLDAQSYIARYTMFGPMNSANMAGIANGAMVKDDLSGLTNVGKIYAGLM